tara:strand:- start:48 stop:689 length:642 start_codon:yes stop_codon:yes gene_type:complete
MTTPAKVQEWLRNNKGNLTDAYRAVGYEGPPLKIKEGNLASNRSNIRLAVRGENGDSKRKNAVRIRRPTTREEQNRNRRQNYKRQSLSKQLGIPMVIDHIVDVSLLYETVKNLLPAEQQREIKKLERSYGPLGDRPGNRQIIPSTLNEVKNQQTRKLQNQLGRMERSKPSLRLSFGNGGIGQITTGSQIVDRANANMQETGHASLMGVPLDLF